MKTTADYCAAQTDKMCTDVRALEEVKYDSSCVKVAEKIPCFAAKKLF